MNKVHIFMNIPPLLELLYESPGFMNIYEIVNLAAQLKIQDPKLCVTCMVYYTGEVQYNAKSTNNPRYFHPDQQHN